MQRPEDQRWADLQDISVSACLTDEHPVVAQLANARYCVSGLMLDAHEEASAADYADLDLF